MTDASQVIVRLTRLDELVMNQLEADMSLDRPPLEAFYRPELFDIRDDLDDRVLGEDVTNCPCSPGSVDFRTCRCEPPYHTCVWRGVTL